MEQPGSGRRCGLTGPWQVRVVVEIRTRVAKTRVRLPDVVVDHARYWPQTLVKPLLLVVEILSTTDSMAM